MYLVHILLPLVDNERHPFPRDWYDQVSSKLTESFGGVTAYTRSPAEGRWKDSGDTTSEDVVVIEVMVRKLDKAWWRTYREKLETTFRQEQIVVRAQSVQLL
jgi:hypothetical protein